MKSFDEFLYEIKIDVISPNYENLPPTHKCIKDVPTTKGTKGFLANIKDVNDRHNNVEITLIPNNDSLGFTFIINKKYSKQLFRELTAVELKSMKYGI